MNYLTLKTVCPMSVCHVWVKAPVLNTVVMAKIGTSTYTMAEKDHRSIEFLGWGYLVCLSPILNHKLYYAEYNTVWEDNAHARPIL
jgi:hypothetical protein